MISYVHGEWWWQQQQQSRSTHQRGVNSLREEGFIWVHNFGGFSSSLWREYIKTLCVWGGAGTHKKARRVHQVSSPIVLHIFFEAGYVSETETHCVSWAI